MSEKLEELNNRKEQGIMKKLLEFLELLEELSKDLLELMSQTWVDLGSLLTDLGKLVKELGGLMKQLVPGLVAGAYMDGIIVKQDFRKAFPWIKQAAVLGNSVAMRYMGLFFYENGLIIKPNEKKKVQWLKRAADDGDEEAREWLERAADAGNERAREWFKRAGDAGDKEAVVML